jgi:hypothetical protein
LRSLATALAIAAATPAARAEKTPEVPAPFAKCSIHYKAKFYRRFDQLPKMIQRDFAECAGPIAEPNEEFRATDVVLEGDQTASRRFVGALESGMTWWSGMSMAGSGIIITSSPMLSAARAAIRLGPYTRRSRDFWAICTATPAGRPMLFWPVSNRRRIGEAPPTLSARARPRVGHDAHSATLPFRELRGDLRCFARSIG